MAFRDISGIRLLNQIRVDIAGRLTSGRAVFIFLSFCCPYFFFKKITVKLMETLIVAVGAGERNKLPICVRMSRAFCGTVSKIYVFRASVNRWTVQAC